MMTRLQRTYDQNGILVEETTIEIPDELDRQDKIEQALDNRIDQLVSIKNNWSTYTTAAQIRGVVYFLLVTVLWTLRAVRNKFDDAEDL